MDVVGHDHKCIGTDVGEFSIQLIPPSVYHSPGIVSVHCSIHDFSEQAGMRLRADGDEIRSRLGIIVPIEADAAPMVFFRIVRHIYTLLALLMRSQTSWHTAR